ncbi:AAA family ATPase [Aeromonas caviae]
MQLKLEGIHQYNGFQLLTPSLLEGNILILTGKNGSGKTRLLESIKNNSTSVSINGHPIEHRDIQLVSQSGLTPNFGEHYNDAQYQNRVVATLQLFDRVKNVLDNPYKENYDHHMGRQHEYALDYESLFKLCGLISKKIGKLASELSHEDIILHFEEPARNLLGIQNISTIVNQYIKRKHKNELNEWACKEKGRDVQFFTEEEFLKSFGDKPWLLINKIIEDTFDGKFQFSIPDETSLSYTYTAQLIQSKEQTPVSIEHLSSGEKTLLWLALTLFNSQYYDYDITHTPKVLLIDEPDAFLHPKMVLKMYHAFKSFSLNFNSVVIITTHSPTTVALAPSDIVYLVENNAVERTEKDNAIAELLDGVTQISLNPNNRRQVYVESQYDADVYQLIFSKLAHSSSRIDPKITLNFISAGPKISNRQIIDKAKQILSIDDEALLNEYALLLNGIGCCSQVIGQVEALIENGQDTVRGIIDWDLENKPSIGLSVLAKDYAYSIDNVTLDPICILLLLHIDNLDRFSMWEVCGKDISWQSWLQDVKLLQESIDRYILKVLGRENQKDTNLTYVSGIELLTDQKYLRMNGHELEYLVKTTYPQLLSYCKKRKDGELKNAIVNKSMIALTEGRFIPLVYEEVLASVQKKL